MVAAAMLRRVLASTPVSMPVDSTVPTPPARRGDLGAEPA
jgi:hypothetical protein